MKKLSMLLALLGVVAIGGNAVALDVAVGPGTGIVLPSTDTNPCPGSTLVQNHDGSFENGYAWAYAGVVAPDYGAWAEVFSNSNYDVCGVSLWLSRLSSMTPSTCDIYVWQSDGNNPTNMTCLVPAQNPGTVAVWPNISQHDFDTGTDPCCPGGDAFAVGYWPTWVGAANHWYTASDEDGFGGLPRTNIAPGIGYPTGWQHPNVVATFAGCQALGIGAYVQDCQGGTPVEESSWGSIKALYN
jgi:hypothetical protein